MFWNEVLLFFNVVNTMEMIQDTSRDKLPTVQWRNFTVQQPSPPGWPETRTNNNPGHFSRCKIKTRTVWGNPRRMVSLPKHDFFGFQQ